MLLYKNTSTTAKTFYGITFEPGEVKECMGYINHPKMIVVSNTMKYSPKATSKNSVKPNSSQSVAAQKPKQSLNEEDNPDGKHND